MLAELIEHIDVYHVEKVNGLTTQKVPVHDNCIGPFEVPDWESIPEMDITIETRKGVTLCYSPLDKAV